ncbi:MAG: hypothetical protein WBD27_05045 [Pyrinomonadaceae bacterium]
MSRIIDEFLCDDNHFFLNESYLSDEIARSSPTIGYPSSTSRYLSLKSANSSATSRDSSLKSGNSSATSRYLSLKSRDSSATNANSSATSRYLSLKNGYPSDKNGRLRAANGWFHREKDRCLLSFGQCFSAFGGISLGFARLFAEELLFSVSLT